MRNAAQSDFECFDAVHCEEHRDEQDAEAEDNRERHGD
jgi:hypothetical protein